MSVGDVLETLSVAGAIQPHITAVKCMADIVEFGVQLFWTLAYNYDISVNISGVNAAYVQAVTS